MGWIILALVKIQLLQNCRLIILFFLNTNPSLIIDTISCLMLPCQKIRPRFHKAQEPFKVNFRIALAVHINTVLIVVEYLIGDTDFSPALPPDRHEAFEVSLPYLIKIVSYVQIRETKPIYIRDRDFRSMDTSSHLSENCCVENEFIHFLSLSQFPSESYAEQAYVYILKEIRNSYILPRLHMLLILIHPRISRLQPFF